VTVPVVRARIARPRRTAHDRTAEPRTCRTAC